MNSYFCFKLNLEFFIAKRIVLGKKHQSSLTKSIANIAIIGISLGVAVMILTFAVTTGFQKEVKEKIAGFSSDVVLSSNEGDYSFENIPLSKKQKFYPNITTDPEFSHIQVFATKPGIIKTKENMQGIVLKGIGPDFNWNLFKDNIKEGQQLSLSDTAKSKDAIISKKIAQNLKLKIGDKFVIHFISKATKKDDLFQYQPTKYAFYVKGLYETGMLEEIDSRFVLIDIKHIRKINGWTDDQVGGFEVFVSKGGLRQDLKNIFIPEQMQMQETETKIFNDYFFLGSNLKAESLYTRYPSMMNWLEYLSGLIGIVIVIILIVSIINMSSALLILILEKTQMIGILKGMGMNQGSIRKIFVYQSAFLIGKGILWGNIIGISLCLLQQYFGFVPMDPKMYYLDKVPINLSVFHLLIVNGITLIFCLVVMILPSYLAAKIQPVKAIRFN